MQQQQHPQQNTQQQQLQHPQLPAHSENVEEELSRIKLALDAVFSVSPSRIKRDNSLSLNNPSSEWFEQRQLADQYLTSFQSTTVSWMVCDRLLQEDDINTNHNNNNDDGNNNSINSNSGHAVNIVVQQQRRFFAAQTLHTKCRCAIHELPSNALPSLRDSLLEHLRRYSTTAGMTDNSALTTRLAMCVSALAVQMCWTSMLSDLLQPLHFLLNNNSNNPDQASLPKLSEAEARSGTIVLTSLLRVLPEECASDRLYLYDEIYRYHMRDHLVSSSGMVFQFLHATLLNGIIQPTQVFPALHTWIRYVPVLPQAIAETPLLQLSVDALMQAPQYLEVAADVIVEILRMYPSHHQANEGLVKTMIPLLSKLPLEAALHESQDEDVRTAYCRVVTEMGESYMSWILSEHHQEASQIVQWVLKCSSISETEIASITLHFWYRMAMDLESIDRYDYRQELVDFYTPHLLQLIDICCRHLMRYPPDILELSGDRIDDLQLDRFYVAETIEDCCRLLGGDLILNRIGNILKQECQVVAEATQQVAAAATTTDATTGEHKQVTVDWQGIESCLACIQCLHRFVPSDEAEFVPFCFQLIPQLPTDIPSLRSTASKTIGKYASWLVAHPQLLQPLMPYLAQGLSISQCAPAAAVAIRELCECSNQSIAMGEPVLQLYQDITVTANASVDNNNDASVGSGPLALVDELQILEGVCRALSRQLLDPSSNDALNNNNYQGAMFFQRIVQPIGQRLANFVNDPNAGPRQIIPEIERLTIVVQHLILPRTKINSGNNNNNNNSQPTPTHPIVELLQSCWTLLDGATTRFSHDVNLAEKVCRFHKHSLRSCGNIYYTPMFDSLLEVIVRNYSMLPHQSSYLYLASIVVTEYGRDFPQPYIDKIFIMINALSTTSFSFLRSLEDLTRHPDVVEELFYLLGRVMSNCPIPLVSNVQLLQSLFQCAAVGMQLQHRDANKGTLNFLDNTINYGLSLLRDNNNNSSPIISANNDNGDSNPTTQQQEQEQKASLEHVLLMEGSKIVHNVARALVGDLPTYSNQISELLWKLKFLCPELLLQWLTISFSGGATGSQALPPTATIISPPPPAAATGNLIDALKSGASRDEFNMVVRSFMSACERERKFQRVGMGQLPVQAQSQQGY